MSRVVHLHIGAPKTGTTYVQNRLGNNLDTLLSHGVEFPAQDENNAALFHFKAALDLLGQDWGGTPGHAVGAWDQMVRKSRRAKDKVIVSHEILAPARPQYVAKAVADLTPKQGELHIVYSVRDLARQLPAAWQESIKQGRKWTFNRFLHSCETGSAWFIRAFDLPTILSRWGAQVPPENIHVVVVPQADAAPDLLWRRFCQAFAIDPAWAPDDTEESNPSLGIVETQLIRQLNRRMGREVRRHSEYDELIRRQLAEQDLAQRDAERKRVTLPPDRYDWAEEQAGRWVDWLEASGVDVIGDLEELRPQRPADPAAWEDPDQIRPRLMLNAALDALEAMTREAARRPEQPSRLPLPARLRGQR